MKKRAVFLILIFICAIPFISAAPVDELHIIYIGNSGITYQQMHRTVEKISFRNGFGGPRMVAHPLCRGGSSFGWHLGNIDAIKRLVGEKNCTAAVVSGSMTFIEDDARRLFTELQNIGLDVYFFQQAESRSQSREVQLSSDRKYRKLAGELGFKIVPLGTAVWDILTDVDPGYDFFAHDGSHASKKSAYLGACMIVSMLSGKPPAPPEPDYDFTFSGMSSAEEIYLRQTAIEYTF